MLASPSVSAVNSRRAVPPSRIRMITRLIVIDNHNVTKRNEFLGCQPCCDHASRISRDSALLRTTIIMLAARHRARLTMEERNNSHESRNRNVRRKLFQDDDDNNDGEGDNFVNRLLEENQRQKELCKRRWNFDFDKEEPLPGRYEWVKIDADGNEIPNSTMLNKQSTESAGRTDEGGKEKRK